MDTGAIIVVVGAGLLVWALWLLDVTLRAYMKSILKSVIILAIAFLPFFFDFVTTAFNDKNFVFQIYVAATVEWGAALIFVSAMVAPVIYFHVVQILHFLRYLLSDPKRAALTVGSVLEDRTYFGVTIVHIVSLAGAGMILLLSIILFGSLKQVPEGNTDLRRIVGMYSSLGAFLLWIFHLALLEAGSYGSGGRSNADRIRTHIDASDG